MQSKCACGFLGFRSKLSCFAAVILIGIINLEAYQLGWYEINVRSFFHLPAGLLSTQSMGRALAKADAEDYEALVPFHKTKINARMIDEFVKREHLLISSRNYSAAHSETRNSASRKIAELMRAANLMQPTDTKQRHSTTRKRPTDLKTGNGRKNQSLPQRTTQKIPNLSDFENDTETRRIAAQLLERANEAFLVNEADICSRERWSYEVETIVIVTSKAENVDRRMAARSTWLSSHWASRLRVSHLFLLGLSSTKNRELERRMAAESAAYHDLLISSEFIDSYSNLARKSVAMLKWVAFFCTSARFLIKADDDSFVNLARLVPILRQVALPSYITNQNPLLHDSTDSAQGLNSDSLRNDAEYKLLSGQPLHAEAFLLGGLMYGGTPHRDPMSKWFVPESEFPANEYPPFALGIGYAMSVDAVQRLFIASLPDRTPFRLEDVYVTGILAERAAVQRIAQAGFFNYLYEPLELCAYNQNVITSHYVAPRHLDELWRQIFAHETDNFRPDCAPLV